MVGLFGFVFVCSFVFDFVCFTEGKYVLNKQDIEELAVRTLFEKIFNIKVRNIKEYSGKLTRNKKRLACCEIRYFI